MPADAALPDDVLIAFTTIDQCLTTLPETDYRPSLHAQFGVFCLSLIHLTSRHHLRYPIGDDYG
jgi:hypothetical protein